MTHCSSFPKIYKSIFMRSCLVTLFEILFLYIIIKELLFNCNAKLFIFL